MSEREELIKTLLAQAVEQLQAGHADVALKVLESIVTQQADCADAWYLLGVIAQQNATYGSAMTLLTRACSLAPNQPDYIVALCEACLGAGEMDQAQACYQLLASISPSHAEALPPLLKGALNGLSAQPLKVLPARRVFRQGLRAIYQQLILHCVAHDVERWWDVPGLQHLFQGESVELMRHALRTLILRRTGDFQTFLRLSRELDRIGAAANDEDRFLQTLAQRYAADLAWISNEVKPAGGERRAVLLDLTVWGDAYIDNFLRFCAPSLLAPGNLDALCAQRRATLLVHTDAAGEAQLRAAPLMLAMQALGVDLRFLPLAADVVAGLGINGNTKYWQLGMTQSLGLFYARALGADFQALYPDTLFGNNYFKQLLAIADKGVPAILQTAFRSDVSQLAGPLETYRRDGVIDIPAGDLLALSLNCIHASWRNVLVNRRADGAHWPAFHALMWESETALHLISPHLSAVYLRAEIVSTLSERYYFTVDSEIDKILPAPEAAYFPSSEDGLGISELSPPELEAPAVTPLEPYAYAELFWSRTESERHLQFFRRSISFAVNPALRKADAPLLKQPQIDSEMNEVRALVTACHPIASPLGTLNGLLSLHLAEMNQAAQADFDKLHSSAAQIWSAGRVALIEGLNDEASYQIMRMLWHFDLLDAAREFLQQSNPGHFLIEVIKAWQGTQTENKNWAQGWRAQHGKAETYLIGSTVWGGEYLQFFLDYHLPAMLASGNFPALAARGKVVLSIVTDAPGQQTIEAAPIMQAVRKVAEVRYSVVATLPRRDGPDKARLFYMHYGLLEHHHVELARGLAANLVLLPVDTVISSHGLQTLANEIAAGHDCCTIAGVESYKSGVLSPLNALRQGNVLAADATELARLAMAHPTRYFHSLVVNRQQALNAHPREFFWQVPGGFVCHSIFMHPLILSARVMARAFHPNHENTDWALMPRAMQADGKVKVLDSSDGLFILHCSEDVARSHEMSPFNGTPTAALGEYLLNVHEHDYPLHRELFKHAMFFAMPAGDIAAKADYAADFSVFKTWFSAS